MGDLGSEMRARALPGGASLQGVGQRGVQFDPFPGQQIVVHHLAQERVPEGVRSIGKGHHDLARHGLSQRVAQRRRVQAAHLGQQGVVQRGLAGQPAEQILGRGREALHPQHQGVAQRRRQGAPPVQAGGQDLLGEERVALAARVHPFGQRGIGGCGQDALELLRQLVPGEGQQLDQPGPGIAGQLPEQGPQRVAAVKLVRAVGGDHQDPLATEGAGQEADERTGGAVGPVKVLHQQEHRRVRREGVQERQQSLEDRGLFGRLHARGLAEPRQDRRKGGAVDPGERLERRVAGADQRSEGPQQGRVGHLPLAQLDAVAAQHPRALGPGACRQLGHQPGLPDARLARHQRQR